VEEIVVRNVVSNQDSWPTEEESAIPPSQLAWAPKTPLADWLEVGRLSWPAVDEF
jgi:hypothetical protein